MARIRSLHPGLFTDENYASLSFPARELLKGLWCESDDQGIFEWKPLTLKMRIFPLDTVDVPALLEELKVHWVRAFEIAGKIYGACRNFCKYQRPKKPTNTHPLPEEIKPYVRHGYKARGKEEQEPLETGGGETASPPLPHQSPTSPVKSGQREEGGGSSRREKEPSEPKTVLQDAPSGKPQGDVVEPEASKALKKVRDDLWSEGTALLGEKNRSALGEAVKLAGGELAAVLDTVRRCAAGVREGTITGNRVAWVMREVRPFKSDQHAQGPPKEPAYLQLARDKFGIA